MENFLYDFSKDLMDNKKKQKIIEIARFFDEIISKTEVKLDEEKYETQKAIEKIEEARYWVIKSII